MRSGVGREEIERLLAGLGRSRDSLDPEEVVHVVERLMASAEARRAPVSPRIQEEIQALATYISAAKAEIAAIGPDEINARFLPAAADELEAILGATEEATNAIFEAVESIESLTDAMAPDTAERVVDAVTRVYEACGFQDITGQRVTKVVRALEAVERKVQALLAIVGEDGVARGAARRAAEPPMHARDALVSGPQLPENGISQDDVDALLADFD